MKRVHPWLEENYRGAVHVYPLDAQAARYAGRSCGQHVEVPHPRCVLCRAGSCEQVMRAGTVCHQVMRR